MTNLCVRPRCAVPGLHLPDCDRECSGCVPNTAGAGLLLCYGCADGVGKDALTAAALWEELALHLAPAGRGDGGGGGGSNPFPSLLLHEGVAEVRAEIRHTLVSWTKLIAEECRIDLPWVWEPVPLGKGVHGPRNRRRRPTEATGDLGRYVELHARWLAAHEAAGEVADEMSGLVSAARRVTGGSGTRVVDVGPCPMAECGGQLRGLIRQSRSRMPSSVTCDVDPGHEWTSGDWMALARSMKVAVA